MPISNLPERELRKMTSQQLADLALAADRESRRCLAAGRMQEAREWYVESERLCEAFQRA